MKRLILWLTLVFAWPCLADGAPPVYCTDAVALKPYQIRGSLPGHEHHRWLEKNIKLNSGKTSYTIRNSACNDEAHPGVSYHYEGYIGMPAPSSCNWYHRGFMFIAINGKDLGSIPLADFSVLEKSPQALCQMVWNAPEATVYARFMQLPGDDMLRCRLHWTPKAEKKVEAVQLRLVCYPSFFTNKPEHGPDRIVVTPRLTAHHRDAKGKIPLQPAEDAFVFYADTVYDVANGKGVGPCAMVFASEQLLKGDVSLSSYAITTNLDMNPALGRADLLFWDFNKQTNADALQRLQDSAACLRANMTALSFEATALQNFNPEFFTCELGSLIVRAKEDGVARQPKLTQSLKRLIAIKQRADAGDPLACGDFASEYDAFILDFTRLKIEALLNSPE